ncbi:glycosyltransferase involved in cell wall biosynthesis [Flavobacterium cauense R2A-7]|uniref:Glycosyltransferase involved in cell wall biosynthesis n=1 Tax=Flavobacterium cauense R2A-7 TaxID=1341154 RepID=A0A562LX63_9FLAO|nr:glycosyltransferase [Flavobacterium cauense]KGO82814.1 hypothetical protein Q762_03385 [Flavobacterium cauense R2A-7]TWI12162.1 glycosyltransferase involved in cell wall biosynthesis [Flavobacterium cauense R2A-7]
MIRVLNIVESITYGGVERRRLSLAKMLNKEEFELKIICTHYRGEIPERIKDCGVEVIAVGKLKNIFDWEKHKKVISVIREFQPHIVHGAVFEGVTMATVSSVFCRVPVLIIEETSDPQNRSWRGNLLMRLFSFFADAVVGVSHASTNYLTETLKISPKKVHLISNGVAIPREVSEKESEQLKATLGIAAEKIIIGSVGRMINDNTKRFSDLIKAFEMLIRKGLNVHLVLVGDGPEKGKYKRLVQQLNIEKSVTFEGYQDDTAKYYAIFDVFSLVSAHESFGLVLAEAMLSKVPIVATKVGGMQYIVDHEKTGYLVEKQNVVEIAQKLEILCNTESLRTEMGKAGYQKAMGNYTEEQYVKRVKTLYSELLKKKKIANI